MSGGLALFWKKVVNIDFLFVDKNIFYCFVQFGTVSTFVSCVYGHLTIKMRPTVWERLTIIGNNRKENGVC